MMFSSLITFSPKQCYRHVWVLVICLFLVFFPFKVIADDTVIIKAVGTWGNFTNYQKHEDPFWNEHIANVSNGSIVGEIRPHTEFGLQGFEIMRLIKNGVFDFAFGLSGYVNPESAIFEGADLSSLVQDIALQKQVSEAYFSTLERAFLEKYNAKLMMLYPFPSQMIWCNKLIDNINDLKGKRIRVYLTTLSDFVEGIGAIPVSAAFDEVHKLLELGIVDCAITGTMSAYKSELYKVANYGFMMRVGWGLAFGAINLDKWDSLSQDQKHLLSAEIDKLNEAMWEETATEDTIALSCLSKYACAIGALGNMTLIQPSASDLAVRDQVATDVVLPRWARRCGPECSSIWNNTVGSLLNVKAEISVNTDN